MADDVSVKFGADTADFQATIAQAKAQIAAFSASTRDANASLKEMQAATAAARDSSQGWLVNLRDLVIIGAGGIAILKGLGDAARGADSALVGLGQTAGRAQQAIAVGVGEGEISALEHFGRVVILASQGAAVLATAVDRSRDATARFLGGLETTAIVGVASATTSAAGAFMRYFEAAAYGERSARLFQEANNGIVPAIGKVVASVDGYLKGVALLKQGTIEAQVATIQAAGGFERFVEAARQGGLGNTTETLDHFDRMLAQIPGMTKDAAVAIETMMVAIPNYTTEANESLVSFLQQISGNADDAVAAAKKITDAFKDPVSGGTTLGAYLVDNEKNLQDLVTLATRLQASFSDPAQATAFFDAMIASIRQTDAASQRADAQANQRMVERLESYKQLGPLGRLLEISIMGQVRAQIAHTEAVKKTTEAIEQTVKALEDEKALTAQIAAAQAREATFQKTLADAPKTVDEQIGDLTTKIDVLQGRLDRAYSELEKDAAVRTIYGESLNQPLQGQIGVAYVLKNRADNGNYGDGLDGVAKAGNGSQFNAWKPSDPNYGPMTALKKDSPEYQAILNNVVNPVLSGAVADPTKGALNYYNQKTAAAPFPMNNKTQIGDHLFGTAPNAPAPIGPLDDDAAAKTSAVLEKYRDALKKLRLNAASGVMAFSRV